MIIDPGQQTFEKMISGMYMGELVRLVMLDMVDEGLMLVDHDTEKLRLSGSFPTKYLSEVEADPVGDFDRCRGVMLELGMTGVSDEDLSTVRYICECVSRRAAFMCAAGEIIISILYQVNHL